MTTPNRTALLNKVHKVLKKHYKPAANRQDQPVLESLLFAACLENSRPAQAELVFEKLKTSFFDWNEVRVSTVKELAEIMHELADPEAAAGHIKGILQSVFESEYSFELESLKKKNLGESVKRLQKLEGASHFIVAYTVQTALGGHSIPVDRGTCGALFVLGLATDAEVAAGTVAGIERAIPKSKGQEFGSLLHQLGADFSANPFGQAVRELLLSIAPDAKDRFPKRAAKKPVEAPAPEPAPAAKKKPGKDGKDAKDGPTKEGKDLTATHAAKEKPREAEKSGKDKTASASKKPAPAAKKSEPARAAEQPKKKPPTVKSKLAVKPIGKRKPR